jgi:hypothetical protein
MKQVKIEDYPSEAVRWPKPVFFIDIQEIKSTIGHVIVAIRISYSPHTPGRA